MSDATADSSKSCSCCTASGLVSQSMKEMDFERGIWQAAVDGDEKKVKKFLTQGVCVNTTDSSGYTALHYACRHGHLAVCEVLVSHFAKVNCQTPGGATPLHKAACSGCVDVVQFLLQNGADQSISDSDGSVPLDKAAELGKKDVIAAMESFDKKGRAASGTLQLMSDYII